MPTCARQGAGCRQWLFPWQIPQRSLAHVGAQPEGTEPTLRRAALLGTYLEQPNHVPRALPCATLASVAVVTKRQQTLRIDLKRSENDAGVAFGHYSDARDLCWHKPVANLHPQTMAGD
ncbi:hypothetical protein FFH90_008360 [Pseudomonas sp. ATCC 43928]|nr:hypothetical protein FFH90_008360 [Pseudomonas sp. ATCC 43928]